MQLSITLILIIVTVLVSLSAIKSEKLMNDLIFYPPAVSTNNQWYRFFSSGFIHAGFFHLLFNMFVLYGFGAAVEGSFTDLFGNLGKGLYLLLYISALFFSLWPTYVKNKNNSSYRSLGASGAVSAVLFAGLLLDPANDVYVYFIKMPSFVFAPLYLLFTAYMDKRGRDNINHSAHLWGALYGLAFVIIACRVVGYPVLQNAIVEIQLYIKRLGG